MTTMFGKCMWHKNVCRKMDNGNVNVEVGGRKINGNGVCVDGRRNENVEC
jgi:hypothetical protein